MDEEKPYFKLPNDKWISGPQDFCILSFNVSEIRSEMRMAEDPRLQASCILSFIVSEKRPTMRMAEDPRLPVFYHIIIIYCFREEAGIEDGWEPQAAGFLYSIFYYFR